MYFQPSFTTQCLIHVCTSVGNNTWSSFRDKVQMKSFSFFQLLFYFRPQMSDSVTIRTLRRSIQPIWYQMPLTPYTYDHMYKLRYHRARSRVSGVKISWKERVDTTKENRRTRWEAWKIVARCRCRPGGNLYELITAHLMRVGSCNPQFRAHTQW